MTKKPIIKEDEELENFINGEENKEKEKTKEVKKADTKSKNEEKTRVKKSMEIRIKIDNALKQESLNTRQNQYIVVDKALTEYLKKRGHKDL